MSRNIELDKFALYAFNCLIYNCKISRPLATNTLLGLLEYYIHKKILRRISIKAFWLYFPKIIFKDIEDEGAAERFILFDKSTIIPIFVFDNYYYQEKELQSYFFYDYMKVISCVKYNTRERDNFLFDKHHLNPLSKI